MIGCYWVTIILGSNNEPQGINTPQKGVPFSIPLPPHHNSVQNRGRCVLVGWSIWRAQVRFSIQRFQDSVSQGNKWECGVSGGFIPSFSHLLHPVMPTGGCGK